MNGKTVDIKTSKRRFFLQYLTVLNPILNLTHRELEVLSLLLLGRDEFKQYGTEISWKLVFDYDSKVKMKEELGMSDYSFNNIITSLRKKDILKGIRVVDNLIVEPGDNFKVTFNFSIDADSK